MFFTIVTDILREPSVVFVVVVLSIVVAADAVERRVESISLAAKSSLGP